MPIICSYLHNHHSKKISTECMIWLLFLLFSQIKMVGALSAKLVIFYLHTLFCPSSIYKIKKPQFGDDLYGFCKLTLFWLWGKRVKLNKEGVGALWAPFILNNNKNGNLNENSILQGIISHSLLTKLIDMVSRLCKV